MAKKNRSTTSDYLDYPEYERLLSALREDELYLWELFARLSFCTACRASDILNMKWQDIFDKEEVAVTEMKTGKSRTITFNNSVRKKMSELYKLLGSPSCGNYIFHGKKSNEHFSIQYVNRRLKDFKFEYKLDVGNFSTHTFRKTFGRYVYEKNEKNEKSLESLVLLNKIFKHTNLNVTETYIGITQDSINRVFDSIKF
jgi:integrase